MKPETRSQLFGSIGAAALVVVFCFLLLAHNPLIFWNDDYELSILPVCADMARSWNHGEMPLLSPYSWVCGNLAGEYQYGVFSIFINALIVAIWKFALTFPQQAAALSLAHLAVLAAGGFMLARGRNLPTANSILVALVAALNGWIVCWGATDWLGALGAFAWLPWAWWACERALDPARTRWRFLWPAPFAYLLFTGGFPYTVLMFGLILVWLSARQLSTTRQLTTIIPMIAGVALGVGLAAPAWLGLLNYIRGSARAVPDQAAHFQWLVPWRAWPALVFPAWTVGWSDFLSNLAAHAGMELACGLAVPAVLLAGFLSNGRELIRRIGWDFALLLVVFLATMLPTAGMFRWSFRWLPLFHLVLALCAAQALERPRGRITSSYLGLALLFLVICAQFIFRLDLTKSFPLLYFYAAIALLWVISERSFSQTSWTPVAVTFATLLATYCCIFPNCGVPTYNLPQTLLQPAPLDPARLYLSFYPPPELAYRQEAVDGPVSETLRLGSTSMWSGLRFVNGYSPIRPAGVAREFGTSIHGEIDQSVALWLTDSEAQPDGLLERLGVDGIVIARDWELTPKPASAWQLVAQTSEGNIYHRRGEPLPRVRDLNGTGASISEVIDDRNRVSAKISTGDQPTTLAFSRPFFPGYRATLNGRSLEVKSVRNLTPLVDVPARTEGRLVLVYKPTWLTLGFCLAVSCAVFWLFCAYLSLRSRA